MLFKVTAMTPQGQWRIFSFQHPDLEEVYQVLYNIVQKGDVLVNVTLIDEHGYLPMPLDALEKEAAFFNPIRGLRQQWEALLAQPVRPYLSKDEFKQRLTGLREDRTASVSRTINHTQGLLERAYHLKENPGRTELINHYQAILDRYSRLIVRLETERFRL